MNYGRLCRNGINHIILMRRVKTLRISLCFENFFV